MQSMQKSEPIFPSLSALHNQTPQVTFNSREWFRLAYYSPLTAEVENNIKIVANQYDPKHPELFYSRFIGVGLVAYQYDVVWAYIYRSQLLLLTEINRIAKPVPISLAQKYYDDAARESPMSTRIIRLIVGWSLCEYIPF